MTYQFHPLPEGLHYQPLRVDFSTRPMWYLHDGEGLQWIDLRSIFRVLVTSWPGRWRGYCEAKQSAWGLEPCFDRKHQETMLAPLERMPAILGEIEAQLLRLGQSTAARRASMLRNRWRMLISGLNAPTPIKSTRKRSAGRRKVNAFVVRQAFLLIGKGHKKTEIARALGISDGALRQVVAGTYSLDAEATDAWWETFGTKNTATACFDGGKPAAQGLQGISGSPVELARSGGDLSVRCNAGAKHG